MRLGHLAACTGLVLVAGCGTASTPETDAPESSGPSATATRTATTRVPGGREAVAPDPRFISYRRAGAAGSGAALITGTLAVRGGCLVLQPGGQVVAFDADHASFDGTTLTLTPKSPGDRTVRVQVGEDLRFGGGYGGYDGARDDPRVTIPRACAALTPTEVAYVEDWRTVS